jgi:hypothetical protein
MMSGRVKVLKIILTIIQTRAEGEWLYISLCNKDANAV